MTNEKQTHSLLDRIGGPVALDAAIDLLCDYLMEDDSLSGFFDGVDLDEVKDQQRDFLSMVLTTTNIPDTLPQELSKKHHRLFTLGLNAAHFDTVLTLVVKTLKGLQVHEDVIEDVVNVLQPFRVVFVEGTKVHLLDKIGGPPALEAAVDIFYERLISDETLTKYFAGVDMEFLKGHQRKFLTLALTKIPKGFDVNKMMIDKHERLFADGLNETHFDSVAGHLVAALEGLQVHPDHIAAVVDIVAPLRSIFEDGAKRHSGLQSEKPTLFHRLGGEFAVDAAVEAFYIRLLDDVDLAIFFEGVSMAKLKQHQKSFFKIAFTKIPDTVNVPKMMLDKHERLFAMGLDETHFDKVAGHLIDALASLGVSKELIDEAVAIVGPLRTAFEQGAAASKESKVPLDTN